MPNESPLLELLCSNCGAPIRTTAAPGTTVKCDCCGSAFLIPERHKSAGLAISNSVVQGDVVLGDKIVARDGHVIILGKDAQVRVQNSEEGKAGPPGSDQPQNDESKAGK